MGILSAVGFFFSTCPETSKTLFEAGIIPPTGIPRVSGQDYYNRKNAFCVAQGFPVFARFSAGGEKTHQCGGDSSAERRRQGEPGRGAAWRCPLGWLERETAILREKCAETRLFLCISAIA
ncbi:MAG: hypothetical protein K2O74_06405 [Eubacteriales bacterium]|nr:hypothetical protein [Eubacteriales bacterium]